MLISRWKFVLPVLMTAVISSTVASVNAEDRELEFNRDVRPIMAAACFTCHGFDEKSRKAELRLDEPQSALKGGESGEPAVVPGDSKQSLVMKRILESDSDLKMPPPTSKHQLKPEQITIIRKWIDQGAHYQNHWSFEPIKKGTVPSPQSDFPTWKSAIDLFLLSKIKESGLSPNEQADKATLIRRVSFTLTGLPPSLDDVNRFSQDSSPEWYEHMVDHYLASPQFGEEMARHWLDVARYGDTHGLHLDNERHVWAYRDWVVSAFNRNLPFDEFTTQQLAGDLLENATQETLTATGFLRCNVTTSEGGAINEEFLFRYAVDRASTTIQTWLGLTGGCAVCHDHKYDPLTRRDFYSMYAMFYSNEDPAMDGNVNHTAPYIIAKNDNEKEKLGAIENEFETAKKLMSILNERFKTVENPQVSANPDSVSSETLTDVTNTEESKGWSFVFLDDDLPPGASQNNTSRNPPIWTSNEDSSTARGSRSLMQRFGDKYNQKIKMGWMPVHIPKNAKLTAAIKMDEFNPPDAVYIRLATDKGDRIWILADSTEAAAKVGDAKRIVSNRPPLGKWKTWEIDTADLPMPEGAKINELELGLFGGICWWDDVVLSGTSAAQTSPTSNVTNWISSFKGSDPGTSDGIVNKVVKEGIDKWEANENKPAVESFFKTWVLDKAPQEVLEARKTFYASKQKLESYKSALGGTMVFKELSSPRESFVMLRGQYDQKGDKVEPAGPSFLDPIESVSTKARLNRLDLSRWLTNEKNPLVARVTVNRFWQQVFGTGIVKTSDDFGTQGAFPTHPELLDYLASQFREEGWKMKDLIRSLITTEAFKQRSELEPGDYDRDPSNKWLARGPRIRLDAEQIRDNALAVSGLLSPKMGGPGVNPYQPPQIWEPVGYADSNTRYFIQDHGDVLYRRSLYTFIKRTAPPPFMSNFDAPNREMFCTRRERSDTPLQALQLMNDVQHVEAARHLAVKMVRANADNDNVRIQLGFKTVLTREPNANEIKILEDSLQKFRARYADRVSDAESLVSVGESPSDESIAPQELAAFTLLANTLLNLDETVNRN